MLFLFQVNMMSAQMLASGISEPGAGDDMQLLEARAAAASAAAAAAASGSTAGGEVKQNISFVRGETQSRVFEESQAQVHLSL